MSYNHTSTFKVDTCVKWTIRIVCLFTVLRKWREKFGFFPGFKHPHHFLIDNCSTQTKPGSFKSDEYVISNLISAKPRQVNSNKTWNANVAAIFEAKFEGSFSEFLNV